MWQSKKILSLLTAISIVGVFFVIQNVLAATSNVNVQIVVPSVNAGCGNNCNTPTDSPPSISSVSSTPTSNSAVVTWTASDDHTISSVNFVYGVTDSDKQVILPVPIV